MAASDDDDDDLKRAIALSLKDNAPASSPARESSYDEDLRLAMALSLEGASKDNAPATASQGSGYDLSQYAAARNPESKSDTQQHVEAMATASKTSAATPFSTLDRKAMEQERLARLGKRKRSASPERPSKQVAKEAELPSPNVIQFKKGAVKRTWAYKYPRTDDITLEEVLQTSTLNIAVLSSFHWDDKWVFHKADPKKIKQVWIIGANTDAVREEILQQLAESKSPNLKPCFPPMRATTTMHSKLMLLFHGTHLRIVVPTANLKQVEWGETGKDPTQPGSWQPAVLENTLFLIDLPRRADGVVAEKLETAFGQSLISFLEAQGVGKNVIEGLHKFDFTETNRFAFVHSM